MKSYREIADSVFERRDQYVIAQRKKKQAITRVTASVGSVALVSLASIALFKNEVFHETPPIKPTTTVTHSPVTEDATDATDSTVTTASSATADSAESTASDIQPTQTEPIVVPSKPTATQTQPTVTQSKPTVTQTEPTTMPTKPTTPTMPEKVLVVADEIDNTGNFVETEMSIKKKYISRRLKETMAFYEGEDYYKGGDVVVYAVIVSMPKMKEYTEDFWNSNEEWAQVLKELDEAYNDWYTEAKQVNPSWDGISDDIEWTDTMRTNYERWLALIDERNSIQSEYYRPYVQACIDQRFEVLKETSCIEPVDILENSYYTVNAYYVELTADAINALAERGGYTFSLAMANQRDYSGMWFDE